MAFLRVTAVKIAQNLEVCDQATGTAALLNADTASCFMELIEVILA